MEWGELLAIVGNEPVFETGILLAGRTKRAHVAVQLGRWTKAGRLYQLRRGLYALAPPYRKVIPHPFIVANRLVRGSYVSLETALSYYGLIPEVVPVTTSVTPLRPMSWSTPLGRFTFHHMKRDLCCGYRAEEVDKQETFIACPEKALIDLLYLRSKSASHAYLSELRLQNFDILDMTQLDQLAERTNKPKVKRAVKRVRQLALGAVEAYEPL